MTAPQVGQSTNLLLKRLVEATEALVASSLQDAPQDGQQYARVNGQWVAIPDPVVDGVSATYDELPVAVGSPEVGDVYLVMEATGVYFVNRHPAGLYIRTGNNGNLADWVYAATLEDSEV